MISAFLLSSCDGWTRKIQLSWPMVDQVAAGEKLDIDGVYRLLTTSPYTDGFKSGLRWGGIEIDSIAEPSICRIDRGRVICVKDMVVKSGSVLVRDLKKIDQFRYEGIRIIPTSETEFYETKTTFLLSGGGELVEEIEVPENTPTFDKPLITGFRFILIEKTN